MLAMTASTTIDSYWEQSVPPRSDACYRGSSEGNLPSGLEATDTVVGFPPILSVSGRILVLRGLKPVTEEAQRESLRVDTRGDGYG